LKKSKRKTTTDTSPQRANEGLFRRRGVIRRKKKKGKSLGDPANTYHLSSQTAIQFFISKKYAGRVTRLCSRMGIDVEAVKEYYRSRSRLKSRICLRTLK
jgi:hypothetical protein